MTSIPSEVIADLLQDKKVLLIGNGDHKEDNLNDYNIVIRCNNGIQKGYADLWVNGLIQFHRREFNWNNVHCKYILRLNAENNGVKLLRGLPSEYEPITYFWTPKEYRNFSNSVGCMQPFTGTTALHWISHYSKPESITVIGMDFFEKRIPASIHKPEMDRAYVSRLIEKFPIISLK